MPIRALLFDLDDTLMPEEPALIAGYRAVAAAVWGESTPERARSLSAAARAVWNAGVPMDYKLRVHFSLGEGLHGEFVATGPEPDALRAFVPRLHAEAFEAVLPPPWQGRSAELVALWRETRIGALSLFDETLAVLEPLSDRYAIALVTNGAHRLQRAKLVATEIGRYLPIVIDSETVGIGKPDRTMFDVALQRLGVDPSQALMIGNDLGRDVAGAWAAGVQPVWINRLGADRPADAPALIEIDDLRELDAIARAG